MPDARCRGTPPLPPLPGGGRKLPKPPWYGGLASGSRYPASKSLMTSSGFANTCTPGHVPVLAEQVLALLDPQPGQVCLDCTVGRGGHATLIVPKLAPNGRYIGMDLDPANIEFCRRHQIQMGSESVSIDLLQSNFTAAREALDRLIVEGVDLLLADLGFSSNQMEDPSRGLSFSVDGPLDMRLDPSLTKSAADLVNKLSERDLADLIYQFGQDRLSRKIAQKIVEQRTESPINSTSRLAEIIRQVYGRSRGKFRGRVRKGSQSGQGRRDRGRPWRIDPATRTFMALRIAVNRELDSLQGLLDQMPQLLNPGAVAAIISFHSLEDRLVKQAFGQWHRQHQAQRLHRKVLVAEPSERRSNPRARSAKLRAIRWMDTRVETMEPNQQI